LSDRLTLLSPENHVIELYLINLTISYNITDVGLLINYKQEEEKNVDTRTNCFPHSNSHGIV